MPKKPRTQLTPPQGTTIGETPSAELSVLQDALPPTADRVNNQLQKEHAAHRVGLTRDKVLKAITDGLQATRDIEPVMKDGTYIIPEGEIADTAMRLKAAELGAKYFGDMKEHATIGNITHNTVIYRWKKTENLTLKS